MQLEDASASFEMLDASDVEIPTLLGDSGPGVFSLEFFGDGIRCGGNQCQSARIEGAVPIVLPEVAGCCVDEVEGVCGLDLVLFGPLIGLVDSGCEPLNLPGSTDDTCPASSAIVTPVVAGNSTELGPCCQANGKCGYNAEFQGIGLGCVSPDRFAQEGTQSCDFVPE